MRNSVSLKVRSIDWISLDGVDPESPPQIPSNLMYGSELPRTDDIDMSDLDIGETHLLSTTQSDRTMTPTHPSLPTENWKKAGGSRLYNDIESPSRIKDEQMKEALRRMNPVCSPLLRSQRVEELMIND